jgi:4-hydroxy-3-methylbut-2-enyl diphosphate reductase
MAHEGNMKLILASPRGFCFGVKQSLALVDQVLSQHSTPIFAFHPIVHNNYVIAQLSERGVIFVDSIDAIPRGAVVIFSAHGVSKHIVEQALHRQLKIFDATCPHVKKIHQIVQKAFEENRECVVIGHRAHAETRGIVGQYSKTDSIFVVENISDVAKLALKNPASCVYVAQTTFPCELFEKIVHELHKKFSTLKTQSVYSCNVVKKRQGAIQKLTKVVDAIIILGSKTSSNAQALKEISTKAKVKTYLIDTPNELKSQWFNNDATVGIATSASAPEILVEMTIAWFNTRFKNVNIIR